jgi:hypothetical protein
VHSSTIGRLSRPPAQNHGGFPIIAGQRLNVAPRAWTTNGLGYGLFGGELPRRARPFHLTATFDMGNLGLGEDARHKPRLPGRDIPHARYLDYVRADTQH